MTAPREEETAEALTQEPVETGAEGLQESAAAEEAQETAPPRPDQAEPVDTAPGEPVDEPFGSDRDDPFDSAQDELAQTQKALSERTLDLQRLQAEYLNYKRRVDRDRELVKQNAVFAVLNNLLPVLDDIDRAREHGELEGGFKAVADSLERTVTGLGLTRFGAPGDEFDPNQHEALMHGHSPEVSTTTVDVVAQAGYRIGDRVVRAARVTVLDPETTETEG